MVRTASNTVLDTRRDAESLAGPLPGLLIEAERVASTIALGVHGRRRPGVGETFWEYRRHQREDGAARVDWRRSARSEQLFVRENEWEAAQTLHVWRDDAAGMAYASSAQTPTKARRAAVLLTALSILATRAGERIGVLGAGARPRMGRAAVEHAAGALHEGADIASALRDRARLSAQARVVLASDFLAPAEIWAKRLSALAQNGVRGALVMVVDPAEESFPFTGRVRFHGPDGALDAPEPLLFGRAETVQDDYRKRYQAHRAAMGDVAARAGWALVVSRTDQPAAEPLLRLYTSLAPARGVMG